MLKQTPKPAHLLRNRFASYVGLLVFVAAGMFMFNTAQETSASFSFSNVAKDDSAGDTGNAGSAVAIGGNKDGGFAWGDINNDGYLDLVVNTNSSSLNTRILIADPSDPANPIFRDSTSSFCNDCGTSIRERSALLLDLNHDGYIDLVRNSDNGSIGSIAIYLNQGPTGFYHLGTNSNGDPNKIIDYPDFHDNNMNAEGVLAADYDQDGWLDLIVENHNFGIEVFQNPKDGSANFINIDPSITGLTSLASDGDYIAGVDYDDDGDIDIMVRKGNGEDFFVSNGDGTFGAGVEIGQASNGNKGGVVFGDFDNDGDFDFYWTDSNGNQIWLNEGGTFSQTYDGSNSEPWASAGLAYPSTGIDGCAVGDVNNDGKLDLFLTDNTGTSFLFLNHTPFGGTLSFTADNAGIDVNGNGEGASFADYDQDGDLDLYVNISNGDNQLWRNNFNDAGVNDFLFVDARIDLGGGIWSNAVGANVFLENCSGTRLSGTREVPTVSGHGTDAPDQVHFGLPDGADQGYNVVVRFVAKNGIRTEISKYIVPADLTEQTLVVYDTDTPIYSICDDRDLDGVPDIEDLDDDNDGIADIAEMQSCGALDWETNSYTEGSTDYQPAILNVGNISSSTVNFRASTTGNAQVEFLEISDMLGANSVTGLEFRGRDSRNSDSVVLWSLAFSEAVTNLDLYLGSLDYHDRVNCYAYRGGIAIPLSRFNFSIPNPASVFMIGESNVVCEGNPVDNYQSYDEAFRFRISQAVDSVVFKAYKNDGDDKSVTLFISDLSYCLALDTDNDGIPNHHDLDSDNDGIPDIVESGGLDTDGNGKADCFDGAGALTDDDTDGWCDTYDNVGGSFTAGSPLSELDQDGDGKPNYIDIDSDNDGITDVVETFGFEADDDPTRGRDGIVDDTTDTDINGWSDSYFNLIPTNVDASTEESANNSLVDFATGINNPDRDGDGLPNFLDIDADDDGIVDMVEAQASSLNAGDIFDGLSLLSNTDSDGDGLMNQFDPDEGGIYLEPLNIDNTDQPDYLDENADNDSFPDLLEGHDGNTDGNVDRSPAGVDSDLDGLDDAFDTDLLSFDPQGSNQSIQDSDNNLGSGGDRDWRELNSSTFPVEWLGFAIELVGENAQLSWETASELNSDRYQVERSLNSRDFETIGEVPAAGMSDTPLSYRFTDAGVAALNQEQLYYRLRQIDLDGGFDFSDLVELQLESDVLKLVLSPNPTTGPLKVGWEGLTQHSSGELQIVDIQGRTVFEHVVQIKDASFETNLRQYPAGIYVVSLQLEDQVIKKKVHKH